MTPLGILALLGLIGGSGAALTPLAYKAAKYIAKDLYLAVRQIQADNLMVKKAQQHLERPRHIAPTDGRLGVLLQDGKFHDLDAHVYGQLGTEAVIHPILTKIDRMERMLAQLTGQTAQRQLMSGEDASYDDFTPDLPWPESIDIQNIHPNPTLDNLLIGVKMNEDTYQLEPVTASLHDMMHTLVVGASGWGKSTWLKSMLWQFAMTQDPLQVACIDNAGSALNALRGWDRLRYPIARNHAGNARI